MALAIQIIHSEPELLFVTLVTNSDSFVRSVTQRLSSPRLTEPDEIFFMSRVSLPIKQAYQAKLQLRRDVRDYEQYFYIYPVGLCCHNETKFTSDLKVVKEIVGLFNERCLILKLFLHTKMSNCHSINQSINQLSIFLTQSSYLFLTIRKLSSWNKRKSIYILHILKDI